MTKAGITKLSAAALVLAAAVLFAGFACNSSEKHTSAQVAAGLADGLSGVEQQASALHAQGKLDRAEYQRILVLDEGAVECDKSFTALVRQSGGQTTATVMVGFAALEQCVNKLESDGILLVNDAGAKATLELAFATIRTAIQTVGAALTATPPAKISRSEYGEDLPSDLPVLPAGVPDDALQWMQLINVGITLFGAGAGIVAKIRGESGMTEDELLAQADTVNDATLAAIKADLAAAAAAEPEAPVIDPQPVAPLETATAQGGAAVSGAGE